jgi:hypothetical protein
VRRAKAIALKPFRLFDGRPNEPPYDHGLMQEASRAQSLALVQRSSRFRIFTVIPVFKLSCGQPMKSRGVLIEKFAGLKMQLTAEQFTYRAFHSARNSHYWFAVGKSDSHFFALFAEKINVSFRATCPAFE